MVVDITPERHRDRAQPTHPPQDVGRDDRAVLDAVVRVGSGFGVGGRLELVQQQADGAVAIGVHAQAAARRVDGEDQIAQVGR